MCIKMNKEQADALCAIIALGFIGQNQREEGTGRTLYIYDDKKDFEKHNELKDLLYARFGIDIASDLQNAKDENTGRKVWPFIYALPYKERDRLDFFTAVTAETDNLMDIVQLTETAANSIASVNDFRGAYIGGFIDFDKKELSLIGPSSLYARECKYIDPSGLKSDLNVIYNNFAHVTRTLKEFLIKDAPHLHSDINIDDAYSNIIVSPDLTEELIYADPIGAELKGKTKVIASCHGLVTSMYYHSDVSGSHLNDGVCIEFSLSDGTCKSASCIPCAIFASAQGAPASQVHFGRGDFWNLPKEPIRNSLNNKMERDWRSFVTACYVSASQIILEHGDLPPVTMEMAKFTPEALRGHMEAIIPDMFLDALTIEGPFIQKMLDSFQLYCL